MPAPTVLSSTERLQLPVRPVWVDAARAVADVVPLMRFRASSLRGRRSRRTAAVGMASIVVCTFASGWLPAYLPGAGGDGRAGEILELLPVGFMGVLLVATVSAVTSAGGRELLPREQAVAFPVSAATDHLGALLMAPLNIAWLVQSWLVLGATAYTVGAARGLALSQLPVLLWLGVTTAVAQALAWVVEWVRRGPHGAWAVKAAGLAAMLTVALAIGAGGVVGRLDALPTGHVGRAVMYGAHGDLLGWLEVVAALVVTGALAVVLGALVAQRVAHRPACDEMRSETSTRTPAANPATGFGALVRTDRVGIWRSVPLRRGLGVLVTLPALAAVTGDLEWEMLTIMPGLVASGGALLFGVNSWCLDGRGALWRESLPVPPAVVFGSRVAVLVEVLVLATSVTLVLACVRAGLPTLSELVAVLCSTVVVSVQVVATSLRWSVRHPFAVDLRSARATPAPPLVMVGNSTRLAVSTTLVALLFTLTAAHGSGWSVLLACPFLLLSALKLVRTSRDWARPATRSRVVTSVAS
ncbi:MAG: hypothetical protein M3393_06525 [Actinomycetota bacterium]|nr:hypothetical protein [Actinomycetota bacterium]